MLMRISAAAKHTGLSIPTLTSLVSDGTLPVVLIRKERRFRIEDLDRLMTPVNVNDVARLAVQRKRATLATTRRNKALRKAGVK